MGDNETVERVEPREDGGPIREFPPGLRGDGKPIRDFPLELSEQFRREFPDFEELFHKVASKLPRIDETADV